MVKQAVAKKKDVKRDSARSKERILEAATKEFAGKGYDGARVDEIARTAGLNKTTIYHYFGNKEKLFINVLERAYSTIRSRQSDLEIRHMSPEDGMRKLVEFTARIWVETPEFNRLLASENIHEARHVRQSPKIRDMYNPLMDTLGELLRKGAEAGKFRADVNVIDLYISITALSAYYISHRYTFEAIFDTPLMEEGRLQQRVDHSVEMILRFLKRD